MVVESVHYSEIVTKECRTFNETSCTNETYEDCHDEPKEECSTSKKEICRDRIEEECVTQYITERSNQKVRECDKECGYKWEGKGTDKRWVVDTSTCKCQDVTRNTVARIPQLNCTLVTREECRSVPVKDCHQVVEKRCEDKVREVCQEKPYTECRDLHTKIPSNISRNKPVQVCKDDWEGKGEGELVKQEEQQKHDLTSDTKKEVGWKNKSTTIERKEDLRTPRDVAV